MLNTISSYHHLQKELLKHEKSFLLLVKKGSTQSECAVRAIGNVSGNASSNLYLADINEVKDIHSEFNIMSVPTLISFRKNQLTNITKGCHSSQYFNQIIEGVRAEKGNDNNLTKKRVTVYSTPTCSWCNTLKRYFDEKGIKYTDIDVSKNHQKAEEMVKRSGQQGVPQTDINGTMVIGFDRNKINELLNLN